VARVDGVIPCHEITITKITEKYNKSALTKSVRSTLLFLVQNPISGQLKIDPKCKKQYRAKSNEIQISA
jgi:hypothetical protein